MEETRRDWMEGARRLGVFACYSQQSFHLLGRRAACLPNYEADAPYTLSET